MSHSTEPDVAPPISGLDPSELWQILEGSTEGTWIFEPDVDRVVWSPRVFALLGYVEQRERFDDIDEIIHPDDREIHRAAVQRVLAEGGQYRIALRIRTASGDYKGISVHGLLLPASGPAGRRLVGFLLDATAELEAKESLARSEAQFRGFMDNCPAAVFLKREDGFHLYANEAAARIAGVTVGDMVGHTMGEIFPPAVADALLAADQAALHSPKPITKLQRIVGADGEIRHVLDTKFHVPDVGSDTELVGGFGLDLTDRVRQEAEIRELDRRVQESQRLEGIGLLAGGVAHDLNNFLLTVMVNAELAMDEEDEDVRTNCLQTALDRCRQAAALCAQLLTCAGKGPSRMESISPAEMIESAGELFDVSRSAGIRIDVRIDNDLPRIHADEVQVRQVLMNLITNAAQAARHRADGLIRLECRRSRGHEGHDRQPIVHSWTGSEVADMVEFVVTDNGVGMDAQGLQRMFEPFYTTKEGGRGLGMPTVMGIVKTHGGAIAVDSTAGSGTKVSVQFPVAPDGLSAPEQSLETCAGSLDLTGNRLLVVDDQPDVLAAVTRLIERLGASVQGAASGEEALAAFAANGAFDVAVVDVTMPGMSGVELARRIRESHPSTGVVLSSGYAVEQSEISESEFVFLRKPYRPAALEAALRAALGATGS